MDARFSAVEGGILRPAGKEPTVPPRERLTRNCPRRAMAGTVRGRVEITCPPEEGINASSESPVDCPEGRPLPFPAARRVSAFSGATVQPSAFSRPAENRPRFPPSPSQSAKDEIPTPASDDADPVDESAWMQLPGPRRLVSDRPAVRPRARAVDHSIGSGRLAQSNRISAIGHDSLGSWSRIQQLPIGLRAHSPSGTPALACWLVTPNHMAGAET